MLAATSVSNAVPTDPRFVIRREAAMRKSHYGKPLLFCVLLISNDGKPANQNRDTPEFYSLEPDTGVTTPGNKVTVHGVGFPNDAVLYIGGFQVRQITFIGPSTLEIITPYLRPGSYKLQLRSGQTTILSKLAFRALPSDTDSAIDKALALASQGDVPAALAILTNIAKNNADPQVRSATHYQMAQIYFLNGDWWRWAGESGAVFEPESGAAVQSSWEYRLSYARSVYLLPIESDPETPLRLVNWAVEYDVTRNPEPLFYRSLINARYGNLVKAEIDSESILKTDPDNSSYRALAAYIAILSGHRTDLEHFSSESITDPRALSLLGEAAYLTGDVGGAKRWWVLSAKQYPLGASLAYWAGKKHMARGQQRVAASLLTECAAMDPNSKEGRDAQALLASSQPPETKPAP
jgi:tetratricopeptide (TPR) repeat protein